MPFEGGKITKALKETMVDANGFVTPTILEKSGLFKKTNWNPLSSDKICESEQGTIQFRFDSDFNVTVRIGGEIIFDDGRLTKEEGTILLSKSLRNLRIKEILKNE